MLKFEHPTGFFFDFNSYQEAYIALHTEKTKIRLMQRMKMMQVHSPKAVQQ